jgi:DNA-binding transcriptional MerR regulator
VGYTAIQAARLSGCTPAQVDTWRRIGLLDPAADSDAAAPYSFRDLVALRMVVSLLDAGLPTARIRRAVAELLAQGEDFTGLQLVTDGETVWACRDDGQILDALRHGQLALFVAVDRLADDVSAQVHAFDRERAAFVDELQARRESSDDAVDAAIDAAIDVGEATEGPTGTGHPCRG